MPAAPGEPSVGELDASRLTHLVGYAASRAAIEMRKVFTRHMGALDLKVVDFSILMLVAANPEVNQKRIGQALDISAPNMAVTLDRLVERGWVQRVRSDKRSARPAHPPDREGPRPGSTRREDLADDGRRRRCACCPRPSARC